MKLKEYLYMIGLKPRPKRYGYRVKQFNLPGIGTVDYAQWLHPSEKQKNITQASVDSLATFLKTGDFCIDIGAHTGDTALPMALAVGASGLVLALEPNPYVFHVLNKNAHLNPETTMIQPAMVAATPEDMDTEFNYSDSGFCNGGRHEGISKWKHGHAFTLTVTGVRLSDFLKKRYLHRLNRLKFIKIDAEGYDLSILLSMDDIIRRYRPCVKTEIYGKTGMDYRRKMYNYFTDHNYLVHRVHDDDTLKLKTIAEDEMMNWGHYDIFCQPQKAS